MYSDTNYTLQWFITLVGMWNSVSKWEQEISVLFFHMNLNSFFFCKDPSKKLIVRWNQNFFHCKPCLLLGTLALWQKWTYRCWQVSHSSCQDMICVWDNGLLIHSQWPKIPRNLWKFIFLVKVKGRVISL